MAGKGKAAKAADSASDGLGAGRRKVRATKTGYYEHTIRQVGDVFIQDDAISPFSEKWMEPVDEAVPEKITGSNEVIQKEHDAILRQKMNLGSGDAPTGDKNPLGA
jgi:hypothetical protein